MQHFPIFLDVAEKAIVLSGGGEAALAKLRLLLKTEADIHVFAAEPAAEIADWASEGKLALTQGRLGACALLPGATLVYAANEDDAEDARVAELAREAGVLVNVVDNLEASAFITPAIVDRDPVTVAIGTEGAAPVLARAIKRDLEARLPQSLGLLARIGKAFRARAEALPIRSQVAAISGRPTISRPARAPRTKAPRPSKPRLETELLTGIFPLAAASGPCRLCRARVLVTPTC